MRKKILYLFSDTGGGHRSAANAIINAVDHLKPDQFDQEMIDVFASCSNFLNIFAKLYSPVIKYYPKMWGQLYYWLDDEKKLEMLEQMSRPFILEDLTKLIQEKKPNGIVSVHPMVNHLTAGAIKQSGLKIPFIVVITDPVTMHRAWVTPEVDQYIVATPEARENALKYGLPDEKIKVIGMPIDPKFSLKEKAKAKSKLFTILMMGGGEGAGKMLEIIDEIERRKLVVQLIVVTGRNKSLETKLKKSCDKYSFPMRVFGFTDQIPELMSESDLIITKAGPGTIAEAMAMGLPIIITSWLPGQEEGNVEFVVRENVGRVSQEPDKVVEIIKEMQRPEEFAKYQENIKRVSRPQAAMEIASEIFSHL